MNTSVDFQIYDALVSEAYKIGTGEASLQSFATLFGNAFPSQLQAFHGYEFFTDFKILTGRSGYDPALMALYDDRIASGMENPYSEHLKNDGFSKRIKFGEEFVSDAELKKTEFYDSFLRPSGDACQTYGITVFVEKKRLLHWGINFNKRFEEEAKKAPQLLPLLTPHLRRGIELAKTLEKIEFKNQSLQSSLNMFSTAAIICDSEMKIEFANEEAEQLFIKANLVGSLNRKLFFRSSIDNLSARKLIKSLATDDMGYDARRHELFLKLNSVGAPHFAFITPLPRASEKDTGLRFLSERKMLVLIINPFKNPTARPEVLRAGFGLTIAEAKLACDFASGSSLREYADKCQISYNTVRVQMQSITNKLGVRGQSDVIKLVSNLFSGIKSK